MQPKLPEDPGYMGDPRRGASLGRCNRPSLCPQVTRKFHLRRIPIDQGGYDPGGAYWGIGQPLYWACCERGSIDFYFRANNREDAKERLLQKHPGAKFYR